MKTKTILKTLIVVLALSLSVSPVAVAAETLKIGFVGVTSGPKAAMGDFQCSLYKNPRQVD